jgi:hypothetical protein
MSPRSRWFRVACWPCHVPPLDRCHAFVWFIPDPHCLGTFQLPSRLAANLRESGSAFHATLARPVPTTYAHAPPPNHPWVSHACSRFVGSWGGAEAESTLPPPHAPACAGHERACRLWPTRVGWAWSRPGPGLRGQSKRVRCRLGDPRQAPPEPARPGGCPSRPLRRTKLLPEVRFKGRDCRRPSSLRPAADRRGSQGVSPCARPALGRRHRAW